MTEEIVNEKFYFNINNQMIQSLTAIFDFQSINHVPNVNYEILACDSYIETLIYYYLVCELIITIIINFNLMHLL